MEKRILVFLLILGFAKSNAQVDNFKVLSQVANVVNGNCPMMVAEATRLDNAVALVGNIFQYNYTLVKLTKKQVDVEQMRQIIPEITNNIRTNPGFKEFRDLRVTFSYQYKDKAGNYVFGFYVTPQQYGR